MQQMNVKRNTEKPIFRKEKTKNIVRFVRAYSIKRANVMRRDMKKRENS